MESNVSVGKIPHSHSSPATMDTTTTAGETAAEREAKKSGKQLSVLVSMLDDSTATFEVQHKALGQVLFDQICKQLHLLEVDYFGLEYTDSAGFKYWLDHEKPMNRQLGLTLVAPTLKFCVKFYTPDPAQLEEEYTRYLFCLQIKCDLSQGYLQCNDNTAALMASYIVQAECGDYVADDYPDHTYLASYKFVPHQEEEMEHRIMENHKRHAGQTPAEADLNLLETARRCELYGIKMHAAKDHEGVPLNLAVAHMGVLVFQNITKINTFSWAKLRKLSFKRKRFLLKLHPEGYGYYKDTVEFYFEGRDECKNFWKKCVEHHGFFRCAVVKKVPRQKTRVISRGSSFRYSGRTQKQIVDYVRDNYVKRQPFQRSQSFRQASATHSGLSGVDAKPLLPASLPTSRSCGSVALSDGSTKSPTCVRMTESDDLITTPDSHLQRPVINGSLCEDQDLQSASVEGDDVDGMSLPIGQEERTPYSAGSHSNLTHTITHSLSHEGPEVRSIDNDDSVSYDSYQLDDLLPSPDKSRKQIGCGKDKKDGSFDSEEGQLEGSLQKLLFLPVASNGETETEMNGTGEIPYRLHRRQFDVGTTNEPPTAEHRPGATFSTFLQNASSKDEKGPPKPTQLPMLPRMSMEFGQPKVSQTSPTLYVRSRLPPVSPVNSQRSKTVDFVAVHDLPSIRSYSSQDDSVPECFVENEVWENRNWRKRPAPAEVGEQQLPIVRETVVMREMPTLQCVKFERDVKKELLERTPSSSNSSDESNFSSAQDLLHITTVEDVVTVIEENDLTPSSQSASVETERHVWKNNSVEMDDDDAFRESSKEDFRNDSREDFREDSREVFREDFREDSKEVFREDFREDSKEVFREEFRDDFEDDFQEGPCKVNDESNVFDMADSCKNWSSIIQDDLVQEDGTYQEDENDVDNIALEGDDEDNMRQEGDDDDGMDPLFPMRTLSRISEHSASDSKSSTPSDDNKSSTPSDSLSQRSNDHPLSMIEALSKSSSSEKLALPFSRNEDSETLRPQDFFYEHQLVLPDDDDSSKMMETTYYLEINSDQMEELVKLEKAGAPIYRHEYDPTEADDTSSVDDTLCEDTSLHECLEDIEEQAEVLSSDTEQELYEGMSVRIHVGPEKSTSMVLLVDNDPQEEIPSMGLKRRHRSELQLHVAKGYITDSSSHEGDLSRYQTQPLLHQSSTPSSPTRFS